MWGREGSAFGHRLNEKQILPWRREPALRYVLPGRVASLDQPDSSRARPGLYLLLARNGVTDVRKLFEVHEPRDAVPAGETGSEALFVFVDAPCQVIRDARVQHARPTRHDIYVIDAHLQQRSWT